MKRYLIIRLGALGDVVLATAAAEAILDAEPTAQVDIVCKQRFVGILQGHPKINMIIGLDEQGRHCGLRGLLIFLHGLPKCRYDAIIDLQNNLRSRAISFCLNGTRKVTASKESWRRRRMVWTKRKDGRGRTVLQRYLEAVARTGIQNPKGQPRIYPGPEALPELPNGDFVVLAPGANRPTKRWGGYRELLVMLGKKGYRVVITGTDDERIETGCLAAEADGQIMDFCGRLDLPRLAGVLSRSRLVVANDTGTMHIAEAAGIPVLAIFGPTVREFGFAPWRPESRVVEADLDCRPCSLHGSRKCAAGHFRCMRSITPDMVMATIEYMVGRVDHG